MAIPDSEGLPRSRQEAKSTGSLYYVSSLPCKRGHLAPRQTSNGNCTACDARPEKRADSVARSTAWLDARPENRAKHNAICNARQKRLRQENPEAVRAAERERLRNMTPEQRAKRAKILRAWRDKNIEHVQAYDREFQKKEWREDPEKARMKGRLASMRRRALLIAAEGSGLTRDQVFEMLLAQDGICGMPDCDRDISEKFDIDHKLPLSRGGSNLPDNLHLICCSCNRQKHDLTVEEFVAKRARRKAA